MRCAIVTNGNINDYDCTRAALLRHDFIICADGGIRHLFHMNLLPNLIVGDFDSIDGKYMKYLQEHNIDLCQFSERKDFTDTELAVQYAIARGSTEINFFGALGSRMDHTLANILLLVPLLQKGIRASIQDEHNHIWITSDELFLEGEVGDSVSILPLTPKVEGVTLNGLEYPLKDATIKMGQSIGVSNQFAVQHASITIKQGTILVIKAKD
ncbi:thiamine diphosphokinase [Geosporobacter ferrireducens]|uniref:Thiamine diphosphokinase n=1 Tax=Geosporobacter ferrireducens TaxID=1424294 RepID=A0A1D8GC19_9FIRM|nr:thiamine diphosphokinase [Geosporobacter ferrireducens]AOT68410.1 thiamine diphosphokinase [Geosporobacter ferrireducens]MTI53863.1 thiamine diphosphokinase [Geosporobacter ferrireducens]